MMDWSWLSWLLLALAALPWVAKVFFRATEFLHILQLDGYKTHRFLKWLLDHPSRILDRKELGMEALLLTCGLVAPWALGLWTFPVLLLAWLAVGGFLILTRRKGKPKKPLVFTPRAVRLLTLGLVLAGLTIIGISWLSYGLFSPSDWPGKEPLFVPWVLGSGVASQAAALVMLLANVLIYPLEATINKAYLASARRKIEQLRPRVMAITGSYGKTSTKHFLASILSQKYRVLMTPESYNTPMGICKVIRGQLESDHQFFVVEMGAYKRGDIRDLCELVRPEVGILTAIGPQHLERFKSLENIAEAKYELIEALPEGGIAVFNDDYRICAELAAQTDERRSVKVVRFGIDSKGADVRAKDLTVDASGLRFLVDAGPRGKDLFETKLLGRHNVSNILAATAVALEYGMTLEEIGRAVKMLEPPAHRLQLIQSAWGVLVIDDAYNANPIGAQTALEVLGLFKNGLKVLVTPGMVELGEEEVEQNRRLGLKAAEVCDFVIPVGPRRTLPIQEGLKQACFPEERVIVVKSLVEATERLKTILKPGDVVLFENDLPDTYNEDM